MRDILCSSHSLPKPTKAFQKLPKAFQSQSMTKPSKASKTLQSLSKPFEASRNCPKLHKTSQIRRSLPKPSKPSQGFPEFSNTSKSLTKLCNVSESKNKWKVNRKTRNFCELHVFLNEKIRHSHKRFSANNVKVY